MEVSPTLFVGIGTSGYRIIEEIRTLMFETYGEAGLPIFQYISIDTEYNSTTVKDTNGSFSNINLKEWEKILMIPIGGMENHVEQTNSLLDRHNKPRHYVEFTEKWLKQNFTKDLSPSVFRAGAGNIRAAGRFCLHANWL